MFINKLELKNFRLIEDLFIDFNSQVNVFIGKNGSGKTSILESIGVLALSKSFRTNKLESLISFNKNSFVIKAEVFSNSSNDSSTNIAIQRDIDSNKHLRLNKKKAKTSDVAKELPFFLLHSDYLISLVNSRLDRLSLLNWGLFHVEQSFSSLWKQYQTALKNRNVLLKNKRSTKEISVWDSEFCKLSNKINSLSHAYFKEIKDSFNYYISTFFPGIRVEIDYFSGWDSGFSLQNILKNTISTDYRLGYTSNGPHRADILIKSESHDIKNIFSKGQQKMIALAMCLASLKVLKHRYNKSYLLLIDDLAAELDITNLSLAYNELLKFDNQLIVTGIEDSVTIKFFNDISNKKIFYIDNGRISSVPRETLSRD